MAVTINKVDAETVYVNGKMVYQDMNGNWVSRQELTTAELEAFNQHLNATQCLNQT